MDDHVWDAVDRLVGWLDANTTASPESVRLLRVLKLSEEVGETAQAVIGALGQNPRKKVSHTWRQVEAELCDVIITAMVALSTLNPEARGVFAQHLDAVVSRSLVSRARPAEAPGR